MSPAVFISMPPRATARLVNRPSAPIASVRTSPNGPRLLVEVDVERRGPARGQEQCDSRPGLTFEMKRLSAGRLEFGSHQVSHGQADFRLVHADHDAGIDIELIGRAAERQRVKNLVRSPSMTPGVGDAPNQLHRSADGEPANDALHDRGPHVVGNRAIRPVTAPVASVPAGANDAASQAVVRQTQTRVRPTRAASWIAPLPGARQTASRPLRV